MEWTDDAILLTVAKAGKRSLVLEVLTENFGRRRCVTTYTGGERPTLLPGSFLALKCMGDDLGKPLIAELQRISGGLVAADDGDVSLASLMTAKDLLVPLLPMEQPAGELYTAMAALMTSFLRDDGRWPVHYAAWEFALLRDIGRLDGVRRCMSAFRHGDTVYVSPRSGKFVTREEAGAFLDLLMPLPGFLLGGRTVGLPHVRQAMDLNAMLLERFALAPEGVAMPATRAVLERELEKMVDLPPPPPEAPKFVEDADTRAKRIEAMRPLLVAGGMRAQ